MPWIVVAGIVGGAALVRTAIGAAKRINQELDEVRRQRLAEATPRTERPTLRLDPVSGAYKPS